MKRFATLAACALFAAAPLLAQPRLEIEGGTTHDWGTVSFKQTPLTADIVLKNVGTELLKLNNPAPACGCTTAPLEKKELQPGESTVMHVTLKVSSNGPVSKSISISSNDATTPNTTLYLKAAIERAITLMPQYLAFLDLETGKTSTARLSINNLSKQEIKLSNATATNGLVVKLSAQVIKPGESVIVEATAAPQSAGYYNSTVTITTDHPDFPVLEFQSYGNVNAEPETKVIHR